MQFDLVEKGIGKLFLSVFDIYKVGIGPSSSHTVGPMVAAGRFLDLLQEHPRSSEVARLKVFLHGSLAFTGEGHGSDRAVVLGLLGECPQTLDPDATDGLINGANSTKSVTVEGIGDIAFDPAEDIIFDFDKALPGHANAMNFVAFDKDGMILEEQIFYSIGGGFVVNEAELAEFQDEDVNQHLKLTRYRHLKVTHL